MNHPISDIETTLYRHVPVLALEWAERQPDTHWQSLEGTLCFADISGFTALAERLAQRGRIGGEELVETLGRVFRTMIGIARSRGGMLLKFGGDALLLFFRGPDHAHQAASAALDMRRALREAAKIPTSVGALRLSMSVGLHSGNVDFFLVGDSHRELVLLGPAANRVVEVENAAAAGEIVVSAETAARLPHTATKPRDDGELLLRWRKPGVQPPASPTTTPMNEAIARTLAPGELGAYLAPGPPDPEHRVACIAFIRFSGTDAILEKGGPDALAAALNTTIGGIQQVLVSEGVTLLAVDLDRDGGKVFLAAGVPYAHEDDEGVMLRALRKIADAALPLPLQMGVNRGHVFAVEVGDSQRAAFSAMGDTTNTAARIASKTPPGHIYAHPDTLDQCLTLYEVTPAEPLILKGKAAPLIVYDVGEEIGLRDHEGLDIEQLVGRAAERRSLLAATDRLGADRGGVLTLVGETGLGKTRLLLEATRDLAPVVSVRGEPYGANSAYRALRDPLRRLLTVERGGTEQMREQLTAAVQTIAPQLLPMLALIGDATGVPVQPSEAVLAIEPRFRSARTADAIVDLLSALLPGRLIIVVDEAHWCDDATSHVLSRLESACGEHPWLLLVARRDVAQGYRPETGDTVAIEPMPDDEMRALVSLLTEAAPLRPHELDAVVRRANGFPLFAEEIIRALRDVGSLDAVPESLEAAMAAQIGTLDRTARRTLQYASVLGLSFSTDMLANLLRSEDHELTADQLERLEEFLIPEGEARARFRHGMLRDTVYEGIAYRLRRRLHQLAGKAMEARAEDPALIADALAIHFSRAGDHEQTWRYAKIAAERARAAHLNGDAVAAYELALDAARRLPISRETLTTVWRELGYSRIDAGLLQSGLDAMRRALQTAPQDPLSRAENLFHLARARLQCGAFSTALGDLTRARNLLADATAAADAPALAAKVESVRTQVLLTLERPAEMLAQAKRAIEIARQAGVSEALAESLVFHEFAELLLQGPGDGEDMRQALEIYEQLGNLFNQAAVWANLGVVHAMAGRLQEGAECFEQGRALYERCGNSVQSALTGTNLAELKLNQGRVDEAEAVLQPALVIMRAARWDEGMSVVEMQLGRALLEQGRLAEADGLLARISQEFIAAGQPLSAAEAAIYRAAGKVLAHQSQDALALLAEAEGRGELGPKQALVALIRALALADSGDNSAAVQSLELGRTLADEMRLSYEAVVIEQALAALSGRHQIPPASLESLGVLRTPRAFSVSTTPVSA